MIILLRRFLIVYGWQYACCKVICQFSRTQLPVNCGLRWGEYVALPRPSHLHEEHCFLRVAYRCQMSKPKRATRTKEERMTWWFQAFDSARERLNCCRYPGQPVKNTGVQHTQQRVQPSSTHPHTFIGENCLKH